MAEAIQNSGPRPLRIVEIGDNELFAHAVPAQTEFYWTGNKPRGRKTFVFGPLRFLRVMGKLRRGEADLLVVHTSLYAPWHPRSFLTALRDWHVQSPRGLFAIFAWRLVHLFHRVPIAVIDLGDSCLIGRHNFFLLRACKAFFKRELPSDHWLAFCRSGYPSFPGLRWRSKKRYIRMIGKLKPISYGAPALDYQLYARPQNIDPPDKTVDIFFAGNVAGNSTVRVAGLEELKALQREGYVVDLPGERMPGAMFLKRLSAAWLAWSPGGLGWECGRHYEAAAAGTVPLINDPTILRDTPLRDGEHCVLYPVEAGGLAQAVRWALADKPRLTEMARAAAAHVAAHHTTHARAERITVQVLRRRLDGTPANAA